jgi:hypothetical protein
MSWLHDLNLSQLLQVEGPVLVYFDNFVRMYGTNALQSSLTGGYNNASMASAACKLGFAPGVVVRLLYGADGKVVNPFRDAVVTEGDIAFGKQKAGAVETSLWQVDVDLFTNAAYRQADSSSSSTSRLAVAADAVRGMYDLASPTAFAADGFGKFQPLGLLGVSTGTPEGCWTIWQWVAGLCDCSSAVQCLL